MVSDLVLLKELPDAIRNSVDSYIGCISGAIMKEEYLKAIRNAGFKDVGIIDETKYPIEFMVNDPNARAIIENFNIPKDELRSVAESVVSIKVKGIKQS